MGTPGNEADTWTQLAPRAIKHGMNYLRENVHTGVVESFDPKMACRGNLRASNSEKCFWGACPETPLVAA